MDSKTERAENFDFTKSANQMLIIEAVRLGFLWTILVILIGFGTLQPSRPDQKTTNDGLQGRNGTGRTTAGGDGEIRRPSPSIRELRLSRDGYGPTRGWWRLRNGACLI